MDYIKLRAQHDHLPVFHWVVTLLSIFVLSFLFGINATADTQTPAINNGSPSYSQDNTNLQQLNNNSKQQYGIRLKYDNATSMYGAPTAPGVWYYKAAIFNIADYVDNSSDGTSNFSEQVVIHNTDSSAMTVNLTIDLPTPFLSGPTAPAIQYAGQKAVTPTGTGTSDGLTSAYTTSDNLPLTASSTAAQWATARQVKITGTLQPGHDYNLDLPLKLTNPNQLDLYNMANVFTTHMQDAFGKTSGLCGLFAKSVSPMADYLGVGKQIGIVTKEDTGKKASDGGAIYKYPIAQDLESQSPVITPKLINSDAYQFNSSFWNDQTSDMYTTTSAGIDASNLSTKDGSKSLISYLNQNGYSLPYPDPWNAKLHLHYVFAHGISAKPNIHTEPAPDSGYGMGIQVIKVIDANNVSLPVGAQWDPYAHVKIWNPASDYQSTTLSDADVKSNVTVTGNVNTSKIGYYPVKYTYTASYPGLPDNLKNVTLTKTIIVTVGNPNPVPVTPNSNSSSTQSTTTTQSNNSQTANSSTTTTAQPALPNYAVKKGAAVYATKRINLYKSTTFTKKNRIAKYPKAKRTNRPLFVVKDYKRGTNGKLRYKVQQYNPYTRKYVKNRVGYITASNKYVTPAYYSTLPKGKVITAINKKGVTAYKSPSLKGKIKTYKKGTHFRVKAIKKYKLTSRYQLTNGHYVTSNKKFVIAGKY